MSKQEFLVSLSRLLAGIPKEESDKAISYFSELIDDKIESGIPEQDVIDSFGNINQLADTIIAESNTERGDNSILAPNKYIAQIATFDVNEISDINAVIKNRSVSIHPIEGNTITVSYYTCENDSITCVCDGTELNISSFTKMNIFNIIKFNIFNYNVYKYYKVKICVPVDYLGNINIETTHSRISSNGFTRLKALTLKTSDAAINVNDITADYVYISSTNAHLELTKLNVQTKIKATTSNASIDMLNCNATEDVTLKTTNGKISVQSSAIEAMSINTTNGKIVLDNIKTNILNAETSNGAISVDGIVCSNISLRSCNGKISGYISGNQAEYNIYTNTSNGHASPFSAKGSCDDKQLNVKTSNSHIDLQFR